MPRPRIVLLLLYAVCDGLLCRNRMNKVHTKSVKLCLCTVAGLQPRTPRTAWCCPRSSTGRPRACSQAALARTRLNCASAMRVQPRAARARVRTCSAASASCRVPSPALSASSAPSTCASFHGHAGRKLRRHGLLRCRAARDQDQRPAMARRLFDHSLPSSTLTCPVPNRSAQPVVNRAHLQIDGLDEAKARSTLAREL